MQGRNVRNSSLLLLLVLDLYCVQEQQNRHYRDDLIDLDNLA